MLLCAFTHGGAGRVLSPRSGRRRLANVTVPGNGPSTIIIAISSLAEVAEACRSPMAFSWPGVPHDVGVAPAWLILLLQQQQQQQNMKPHIGTHVRHARVVLRDRWIELRLAPRVTRSAAGRS